MSGESDEFNFVSIISTRLVEGIPSVFPECVKEKKKKVSSVIGNYCLPEEFFCPFRPLYHLFHFREGGNFCPEEEKLFPHRQPNFEESQTWNLSNLLYQ